MKKSTWLHFAGALCLLICGVGFAYKPCMAESIKVTASTTPDCSCGSHTGSFRAAAGKGDLLVNFYYNPNPANPVKHPIKLIRNNQEIDWFPWLCDGQIAGEQIEIIGQWSGDATFEAYVIMLSSTESKGGIVFMSARSGNGDIFSMSMDGASQTNLSNHPAEDGTPSWSPDGRSITFASSRTGNWDIFVMNADGTSVRNITNNSADDGWPMWSPSNDKILFLSDRNGNNGEHQMYTTNVDGGQATLISPGPVAHAAWSPDGNQIIYSSLGDLYIFNVHTKVKTRLTSDKWYDDYPAWSTDGAYIAFSTDRHSHNSNKLDIYLLDIKSKTKKLAIKSKYDDRYPSWTEDGRLVFVRATEYNSNDADIFITDRSVSKSRPVKAARLTQDGFLDNHPSPSHHIYASLLKDISVTNVGCGCYIYLFDGSYPDLLAFSDYDGNAWVNVNGRDIKTTTRKSVWWSGDEINKNRWARTYTSDSVKALLVYLHSKDQRCAPDSHECEVEGVEAQILLTIGKDKRLINGEGECGC